MSYRHGFCCPARVAPMTLLVLSMVSLFSGCGFFEGESGYQQVKDKEQAFADMIADAGGSAKIEGRAGYGQQMSGWFIDLSGAEISPELVDAMVEAVNKDPVFQLNLSKSTITDDQLAKLDEGNVIQKCFQLNLSDTAITDAGLDRLSNFYVIQELRVKGSKVTKEAVQRLGDKQVAQEQTPQPLRKHPNVDI